MRNRWTSIAASFVTASVITLAGVLYFFEPIAEACSTTGVIVPPAPLSFFIYVGLCVALFDWLARQMQSPNKAAFALAAGQFVLAIDLALRGERGLLTLAASGILLAVTWFCVAYVYSKLRGSGGQ